jgi:Flp pilus assembly pilin Flp
MRKLKNVVKNQRGQGMVEYVLLIGIVVVIAIALKEPLKTFINDKFNKASGQAEQVFQQ